MCADDNVLSAILDIDGIVVSRDVCYVMQT